MLQKRLVLFGLFVAIAIAGAQTPPARIVIDPSHRHQVVQGFGVNYTGPYFRDDQKAMFDRMIDDLGVTMFRVVAYFVYSNWEEVNDNADPLSANWAYYDERYSNPVFEASWKGMRYLNSRGIRPVLALMGAVPEWMNEPLPAPPKPGAPREQRFGRLDPAKYDEFAETVVTMATYARRKAGIEFEYFSPINETDIYPTEGPRVDPPDMPGVLSAVARRMNQEGLGDVRLLVAEQGEIKLNYVGPLLRTPELMKQVGAFALHSYSDNSVGPTVNMVRASQHPQVPVWLTEYGSLEDENRTFANEWKEFALASSRRGLLALNQGATALFYFNAFDDYEECMKRHTFYGLFTSAGHVYVPRKRYYATRQLYHFVAPGAERVEAATTTPGLTISAFRDGGKGTLTLVGVKEGGPNHLTVSLASEASSPRQWDLYITTPELDCRKVETFDAAGSAVEFDLPAEAVFTLVGKNTRTR